MGRGDGEMLPAMKTQLFVAEYLEVWMQAHCCGEKISDLKYFKTSW